MVTWYYKDMSSNSDFGLQTAYLSFLACHSILYKLLSFIFDDTYYLQNLLEA
jgi:hypothetical protein